MTKTSVKILLCSVIVGIFLAFGIFNNYMPYEQVGTTRTYKDRNHIQIFVKNDKGNFDLITDSQVTFSTPKKIAIMYIATGRYIRFWKGFYESAEKYLLPKHQKTYFLFTDDAELKLPDNVVKIHQKQESWPNIPLKKFFFYTTIEDKLKDFDYIYYFNANTIFKSEINEEFLPTDEQGLVVQIHPGFYRNFNINDFTYDRNPKSKAFCSYGEGKYYLAAGLVGGTKNEFIKLSQIISKNTAEDLQKGSIAKWHDESYLNRYIINYMEKRVPLILLPNYLMPEVGFEYLDEFRSNIKILLLEKSLYGGHAWFRGQTDKKKKSPFQTTFS